MRVPGAGRLNATATRAGRKVAAGSKSVQGGNTAVRLRFTKAARRSLKHARSVKLRIKVAFSAVGGGTQRKTVALKLTRWASSPRLPPVTLTGEPRRGSMFGG